MEESVTPCPPDCTLCALDKVMDAHWESCPVCNVDSDVVPEPCPEHDRIADEWNEEFDRLNPPDPCEGEE